MRTLVVDDDATSRLLLADMLTGLGHEPVVTSGGQDAWDAYGREHFPLVISDRLMPEVDGIELCRRIRAERRPRYTYFMLVTVLGGKGHYMEGMDAGADDYILKPVDPDELRARVGVATRVLGLQEDLRRIARILPMCSYCRKIRDTENRWNTLERYLAQRTDTTFTHSICPDCYTSHWAAQMDRTRRGSIGMD